MHDDLNISKQSTDQPCPSRKSLIAFWEGKLSGAERNVITEHLASCEFCQEATEGYSSREHKTPIAAMLSEIDAEVDRKVEYEQSNRISGTRAYFNLAAILIVLVIAVFFISKEMKSTKPDIVEMVENEQIEKLFEPKEQQSVIKTKRRKDKKNEQIAVLQDEKSEEETPMEILEQHEEMAEEVSISESEASVEEVEDEEDVAVVEVYKDANKNVESKEKKNTETQKAAPASVAEGYFSSNKPSVDEEESNKSRKAFKVDGYSDKEIDSIAIANEFFINGMNYYNEGDYKNAQYYFSNSLKFEPINYDAWCYSGMTNFNQKNYKDAVRDFDLVINNAYDLCFEQANWYKAQSLVKLGKTAEAKSLLAEISESESRFRVEAATLLNTLK